MPYFSVRIGLFGTSVCPRKYFFFKKKFNCDSPHVRLNSHYEAWSYKKKSTKKITEPLRS